MDLTEKKLAGEQVFSGGFIKVQRDSVALPDGSPAWREYIRHPGAVAVLALADDGKLLLERQFRYPLARTFLEIPAGKIDPQEAPLTTAKRELLEETGYRAANWFYLGKAYPCIGYSDEVIHYYLATALTAGERQLDEGEFLEVLTVPLAEVMTMTLDGRICDSKSLVGLHWLAAWQRGELRCEAL
ncbi:NUDIX domain-containing protein [Vogesella indigofera]|uniref:NUDIX domain-containing protein n=1 Tax=Vogesella indigofera TaxID=45465 RepID=UPI00234EB8A4|nr:NUDIX hydrolase [Vogesella indigofera]MDC7710411.1 NUDIX hydrolase [Vogesella indigofera]